MGGVKKKLTTLSFSGENLFLAFLTLLVVLASLSLFLLISI